jgi:hypothetical protein
MPDFIYTDNIPAASHNPSADQPIMQINTNSIDGIIGVDHFSFNDINGGYHKQVNLVNEANPGTPSGVGSVLFSKNNEWFFQNLSLGLNAIQMTKSAFFPVQATNGGRTFFPGGIILQWGFVIGTHGGDNHFSNLDTGTVTFATPFPTACVIVLTNPSFTNGNPPTSSTGLTVGINATLSPSSFGYIINTSSAAYTVFFWVAIGY